MKEVVLIIVGIVIVLLIIYFFVTLNSLVKLKNRVKEAFSTMDVYLKKRWDLIPNLVEVVKGYASYESETLEKIITARNNYDNLSSEEKLKTNKVVSNQLSKILMLVENYPEIKANENFLNLSKKLSEVENEIADARKYYNATVRIYNNKVEMIPSNIVAKLLGYKQKDMFEASVEERVNPGVDL